MAAQQPPALVSADGGNSYGKIVIVTTPDASKNFWFETSIPHAVLKLSDAAWEQEVQAAKSGRKSLPYTHSFRYFTNPKAKESVAVKIGNGVQMAGATSTIMGNGKYVTGYFDAYITALFCEMFPKASFPTGHDNIYLVIGVPPTDWAMSDRVMALANKTHYIQDPDGTKRKFVVRAAMTADENGGGMVNAIHLRSLERRNTRGKFFAFAPDSNVVIIDSGGWLGSVASGVVANNGYPIINYGEGGTFPIPTGIVKVRSALFDALKHKFPDQMQGMNNPPASWLDRVLREKSFTLSGNIKEVFDATDAVKEAAGYYLQPLSQVWANGFDSGKLVDSVILTGGSIDPLYDYITGMLNHQQVVLADVRSEIHFANSRGMIHILVDKLITANKLPAELKGLFKGDVNNVN